MPFTPGITTPPIEPLNRAGSFWLAAVAMNAIAKISDEESALVLLKTAQAYEQASLQCVASGPQSDQKAESLAL